MRAGVGRRQVWEHALERSPRFGEAVEQNDGEVAAVAALHHGERGATNEIDVPFSHDAFSASRARCVGGRRPGLAWRHGATRSQRRTGLRRRGDQREWVRLVLLRSGFVGAPFAFEKESP